MDLLISASAAARLGPRLSEVSSHVELLQLDPNGKIRVGGHEATARQINPQAAWLSVDVFAEGQVDRFFETIRQSPTANWLHTAHAGLDLPIYSALRAHNVRITNSHVQAPAVAEFVLANVLAVFQALDRRWKLQGAGCWQTLGFRELAQSRWLVVGMGHIGAAVAHLANAFGAQVIGVRRREGGHAFVDRMITPAEMFSYLPESDVVVLSCPLTEATRGLVDVSFVAAMKSGSVLVNVARGALVDECALIDGLNLGRPQYAVLDVTRVEPLPPESRLWTHEHVRLTAHSAFCGSGTVGRGDQLFLENLRRYCAGEPLLNEVGDIQSAHAESAPEQSLEF